MLNFHPPKCKASLGYPFGFTNISDLSCYAMSSLIPSSTLLFQVAIDSATPLDDAGPSNNYMMDPPPPAPEAYGGYGGPMRTYGRMYGGLDYDDVSI